MPSSFPYIVACLSLSLLFRQLSFVNLSLLLSTETMCWPDPGEEPVVKTIILDDNVAAKRATKRWGRDKVA